MLTEKVKLERKRLREKYKDFGKQNPKKEKELKEAIRSLYLGNCPFHENCPWCNMEARK